MTLPPESHRLQPDHLPTPFSGAQIREGCPAGRTIRIREETPGQAPSFRRIRFTRVDDDTAVSEVQVTDEDGGPIGEPIQGDSTWVDLQRHASQPANATTVDEVLLTLPFGDFSCWLYTVQAPGAEVRFWFAKELPGMPVQVEKWVDGAVASRTVMIASDQEPGWGSPVEKGDSVLKTRG